MRLVAPAVVVAVICFSASPVMAAEPRVDLELATEAGFDSVKARTWLEMLSQVGFSSVRIRTAQGSEQPTVASQGSGAARSHHVVGILTPANELILPKGRFGQADRGRLAQWLARLRDEGEAGLSIKPVAFGLLPEQLQAVQAALAKPVAASTKGKRNREITKSIADRLTLKFISDPAVAAALATDEPVADELQGLTSGTALAALLRPLGLVLIPERDRGETRLRIAASRGVKEYWPIGWPPKGNPRETLPDLFKFLKVEITQTPVSEAIFAIGERLKTPVLIDHNSVARYEVDLETKVSYSKPNTFYGAALDQLLFPAKLKYELRVDEAEHPFLWITTVRQL